MPAYGNWHIVCDYWPTEYSVGPFRTRQLAREYLKNEQRSHPYDSYHIISEDSEWVDNYLESTVSLL